MHFSRKYQTCKSKTETLRDENVFLDLKVRKQVFNYKLVIVIFHTFIVPTYRVYYIIVSECILFITLFDDLNIHFNFKRVTSLPILGPRPPTFLGAYPPLGYTTVNTA